MPREVAKRVFTYEEAAELIPEVRRLTGAAVERSLELVALQTDASEPMEPPSELLDEYQTIVAEWADAIQGLGAEVKGLWLVDFDCGSGYYCWKHPEPALQYFHGYDEGFRGRVLLN